MTKEKQQRIEMTSEFYFTGSAATNSNKEVKFRPSDLFSSIISQPLYFSYLIFFSPYLFKLLSFLSPLFITTTLLVLISLVTTLIHDNRGQGVLDLQDGLARLLCSKVNDDGHEEYPQEELVNFEEFDEVYKIIFGPITTDDESSSDQSSCSGSTSTDETLPNYEVVLGENYSEELPAEKTIHVVENTTISSKEGQEEGSEEVAVECGKDEEKCEKLTPTKEKTEEGQETAATATIVDTDSDELEQVKQEASTISTESLTTENQDIDEPKFEDAVADQKADQTLSPDDNYHATETEYTLTKSRSRSSRRLARRAPRDVNTNNNTGSSTRGSSGGGGGGGSGHYEAFRSPPYLGNSFGSSMRKEKEWRRTLACKLFEERHNSNHVVADQGAGEECMDSLWETTCDNEAGLKDKNNHSNNKKGEIIKKTKKEKKVESLLLEAVKDVNDEDDEYDYGEDDNGRNGSQLCCLQALKFSAGKMNLGMKRPNLMKITKAFKGMGWLHQHGVSNDKTTRKGYK